MARLKDIEAEAIKAEVIKAILDQSQAGRIFTSPWGRSRSPWGSVVPIVRWVCVGHDPTTWQLLQGKEAIALALVIRQPSGNWMWHIPDLRMAGYSPSLKLAQQDVEDSRHLGVAQR